MDEASSVSAAPPRRWWVRALLMILMAVAFQLTASVLVVVAIVQLILTVATGDSNEPLRTFGRGLGRYLAQIAMFESFGRDEPPFPFSDWPAAPV